MDNYPQANENYVVEWQARAECRGEDPDIFYPGDNLSQEQRAKAICGDCAVRSECLEFAIVSKEPEGIWGGKNEKERRNIVRKRRHATRLSR